MCKLAGVWCNIVILGLWVNDLFTSIEGEDDVGLVG